MKFRPEVALYSTIDNLLHPAASQVNSNVIDCLEPLFFENMSHTCPFLLQLCLHSVIVKFYFYSIILRSNLMKKKVVSKNLVRVLLRNFHSVSCALTV